MYVCIYSNKRGTCLMHLLVKVTYNIMYILCIKISCMYIYICIVSANKQETKPSCASCICLTRLYIRSCIRMRTRYTYIHIYTYTYNGTYMYTCTHDNLLGAAHLLLIYTYIYIHTHVNAHTCIPY